MSLNGNNIFRYFRFFFGIFMVLVYLGMAALLVMNFFNWDNNGIWLYARYFMAAVFGLYGIYRFYRQVKGTDYYRLQDFEKRRFDRDDDSETKTTTQF